MNTKLQITRTSIIFICMTVAGIAVAASAQIVGDTFAQSMLVSFGSAIFCAGLAFFLMRMVAIVDK